MFGHVWKDLGSQPAVGFAGLCSRAVHQTGRRLKAFEGVNTIFWQSLMENGVDGGKKRQRRREGPNETNKQRKTPPRETIRWQRKDVRQRRGEKHSLTPSCRVMK